MLTPARASASKRPSSRRKRALTPATKHQISIYDSYVSAKKSSSLDLVTVDDDDAAYGDDGDDDDALTRSKKKRRINIETTSGVDSYLPLSSRKTKKDKRRTNLASRFNF